MTISSTSRKAGPFYGNNVTAVFPFTFKVFEDTDMVVVATDASDVESTLTLTTHYTVSINADQDANPGGTVTCVTAPDSGTLLTITSDVPDLQPVSLTNGGGFYPAVINGALDRLTIQVQQVAEAAERAVKVQISSSTSPDDLIAALTVDAAAAASSAAAAASSAAAAAAAIPVGTLGYTPVDEAGHTMTGELLLPSIKLGSSASLTAFGNAATKSVGVAAGNIPLWEQTQLNGMLSKIAAYSITTADRGKLIDFSGLSSNVDATLPTVADGLAYPIRNSDATYSVALKGAETIDGVAGATGVVIPPGGGFFVVGSATEWKTVGRQMPSGVGQGQSWSAVTRVSGTTYYTGSRAIALILAIDPHTASAYGLLTVAINGGPAIPIAGASYSSTAVKTAGMIVIPENSSYVPVNAIGGTMVAYELS